MATNRSVSRKYSRDDFLLVLVSIPITTFISCVVAGFTFMTLWNWFIPPIFELPTLSFISALGIAIVFEYLLPSPPQPDPTKPVLLLIIEEIIQHVFRAAFFLVIGWIAHQMI